MGFDIKLVWRDPAPDPVQRNRALAESLISRLPGISEFPLDHSLAAASLGVAESDILNHWPQIELNGDAKFLEAIVTLWLDRAYVELPSTPAMSCADALTRIKSLLDALEANGLVVENEMELLAEYEAQRVRVERLAELIAKGQLQPPHSTSEI